MIYFNFILNIFVCCHQNKPIRSSCIWCLLQLIQMSTSSSWYLYIFEDFKPTIHSGEQRRWQEKQICLFSSKWWFSTELTEIWVKRKDILIKSLTESWDLFKNIWFLFQKIHIHTVVYIVKCETVHATHLGVSLTIEAYLLEILLYGCRWAPSFMFFSYLHCNFSSTTFKLLHSIEY